MTCLGRKHTSPTILDFRFAEHLDVRPEHPSRGPEYERVMLRSFAEGF